MLKFTIHFIKLTILGGGGLNGCSTSASTCAPTPPPPPPPVRKKVKSYKYTSGALFSKIWTCLRKTATNAGNSTLLLNVICFFCILIKFWFMQSTENLIMLLWMIANQNFSLLRRCKKSNLNISLFTDSSNIPPPRCSYFLTKDFVY